MKAMAAKMATAELRRERSERDRNAKRRLNFIPEESTKISRAAEEVLQLTSETRNMLVEQVALNRSQKESLKTLQQKLARQEKSASRRRPWIKRIKKIKVVTKQSIHLNKKDPHGVKLENEENDVFDVTNWKNVKFEKEDNDVLLSVLVGTELPYKVGDLVQVCSECCPQKHAGRIAEVIELNEETGTVKVWFEEHSSYAVYMKASLR